MAITKRPKPSRPAAASAADQERKIEAFIAGPASTTMSAEPEPKRTRVMMRFDPDLLRQIDAAAKRRGVSRTAWLHLVASRALDHGEG
jgi:hypothetical protein